MLEILEIVANLKPKSSSGPDNLPTKVLKKIIHGIVNPLTVLINRTLAEGIFPDTLKIAKVTPIYKKGEHDQIGNYRPISLLSSISKIFEKVIFTRIYKFLNQNNLFDSKQFGFRPKHSTIDAISMLANDIYESFDNNELTIAAFCDLSKAFDTIDHNILLYKLHRYGIRGNALKLITSYLHRRKHFVQNDLHVSNTVELPGFGAPQG